jgi:uncharacterized protein YgbK (DUF1537 family)
LEAEVKKLQPNDGTLSIASDTLTPMGQSELLRHLGSQMRDRYQKVMDEAIPDHLKLLLDRLEELNSGTCNRDA